MKRKFHVRFGERDGENRAEQSVYGVPVPTLRDPSPSPDDVAVTRAVVQAGRLLDIGTLDHLIIGRGRFVSLKEKGLGFESRVSDGGGSSPGYPIREDFPLIFSYTRAQALADGVLVDVSSMAAEAGFRCPTAITANLHARLEVNQREQALGQSYAGRLWDVLWMASIAARSERRNNQPPDRASFKVNLFEAGPTPPQRTRRSILDLWFMVGPGDQGEPVITIGFPEDF